MWRQLLVSTCGRRSTIDRKNYFRIVFGDDLSPVKKSSTLAIFWNSIDMKRLTILIVFKINRRIVNGLCADLRRSLTPVVTLDDRRRLIKWNQQLSSTKRRQLWRIINDLTTIRHHPWTIFSTYRRQSTSGNRRSLTNRRRSIEVFKRPLAIHFFKYIDGAISQYSTQV